MNFTKNQLCSRAERFKFDPDYYKAINEALKNRYDAVSNRDGIINIGTAINGLMDDVWIEKLLETKLYEPDSNDFRYYQFWGTDEFRIQIAKFMTTFFKPFQPLNYENLIVLNGALVSLDIIGSLLADENDGFLCMTPCYNGYFQACVQIPIFVRVVPVAMKQEANDFQISIKDLDAAVHKSRNEGVTIKALIFNNPHNPLGKVYVYDVIVDIMKFCQRHHLHLIVDEMYCMSVFDKSINYRSMLSIDTYGLMDSKRLHVIWGFSKDLCLTSYRTGIIHTQNEQLLWCLQASSQFQAVPLPIMKMLGNILDDRDWFENIFVPLNHKRLENAYLTYKNKIENLGINTTRTSAGFFFLADFRHLLRKEDAETSNRDLFKTFLKHKLYVTPSWEINAEPGWFRIVFSVYKEKDIDTAFKRLKDSIEEIVQRTT